MKILATNLAITVLVILCSCTSVMTTQDRHLCVRSGVEEACAPAPDDSAAGRAVAFSTYIASGDVTVVSDGLASPIDIFQGAALDAVRMDDLKIRPLKTTCGGGPCSPGAFGDFWCSHAVCTGPATCVQFRAARTETISSAILRSVSR